MVKMLNIAAIQFEPEFLDMNINRKKIENLITKTISENNSELIVLPELSFSGYNFKNLDQVKMTSEKIPDSESCKLLEKLSRRYNVFIVAGINEQSEKKYYNTAVIYGPSGFITKYRKLQLYYREKKFFTPGNLPLQIFELNGYRVGIMICFDWFFPEIPRTLALNGADIICHIMNAVIPDGAYIGDTYYSKWNRIFIILANRIGKEDDLEFIGRSVIIDNTGKILKQASNNQEEILSCQIEPNLARNKKLNEYNDVIKDRRIEFYRL